MKKRNGLFIQELKTMNSGKEEESGDKRMSIYQRIMTCILLEKMNTDQEYSRRLGLKDVSVYRGAAMELQKDKQEEMEC